MANSNNKNCRGLGRLSFLQVFNKSKYHGVFIEDGEYKEIDFCFDENFDKINEKDVKPSIEKTTGTILTFEDITKEFIDDENNVFSAEKILTRLLDDILPHLLQYNCKIIADGGDQNKSEHNLISSNLYSSLICFICFLSFSMFSIFFKSILIMFLIVTYYLLQSVIPFFCKKCRIVDYYLFLFFHLIFKL